MSNYTEELISKFKTEYGLGKDDFWNLARGGKDTWIIKHNALEKIVIGETTIDDYTDKDEVKAIKNEAELISPGIL